MTITAEGGGTGADAARACRPVKLQYLVLAGPAGGHAPKGVKLFVNRPSIGFDECVDESAQQEVELSEAQAAGEAVPLKLAKFSGVNTLTIFVGSNQGDEEATRVSKIVVSGMSIQGMNVGDIKKGEEQ
jgi:PITH domain